jgi:hypothetical protein
MKAETPPVDESVWVTEQGEGGLVIIGCMGDDTVITIPAAINGATVVAIGWDAFSRIRLTSVTIPDSVTSIGEGAFDDGVEIIRR